MSKCYTIVYLKPLLRLSSRTGDVPTAWLSDTPPSENLVRSSLRMLIRWPEVQTTQSALKECRSWSHMTSYQCGDGSLALSSPCPSYQGSRDKTRKVGVEIGCLDCLSQATSSSK